MSAVSVIAGALLIGFVAREVFHTLFHPSGQGSVTMAVFGVVWRLTGQLGGRARGLAGPLAMTLVIALWILVSVSGWALVYLPALPDSFIFASGLEPRTEGDFIDAVYFAWVTQATLGFGDIAPEDGLYRVLAPVHATLGFALFTLVVTWVLSVYPALQRQRAAASLAHGVRRSYQRHGWSVPEVHPATLARQMERLADLLNGVRVDFIQYPSTFYYAAPAGTLSLAEALPFVVAMAEDDGHSDESRPAAAELAAALELLSESLAEQHLGMPGAERDDVVRAYRRHHRLPVEEAAG